MTPGLTGLWYLVLRWRVLKAGFGGCFWDLRGGGGYLGTGIGGLGGEDVWRRGMFGGGVDGRVEKRIVGPYVFASHDNGYNQPELLVKLELASLFSIHGCRQCCHEAGGARVDQVALDAERGTYVALSLEENANKPSMSKSLHPGLNSHEEYLAQKTAGIWGYIFQIIYQICAGAVVLTDCVFWFIIFPFLTSDDYSLDFIDATFHSLNAVLLLGDVILNCLRFPFFRITYFIQWTSIYVIFQWIVHACVSMWWPYPFLDLSTPYAPIWYLAVGLLHLPCYGAFALIVRLKNYWLSRAFPDAIQI
ncbi:hypothetical protein RHGRI_033453 [Rhododendron griersonianum]|uniref:Uncharacterized protein n=1 Tax=Rhododendron griersonianum TaxID=479676 RepID=A0AAV6I043_9ERIC|nr:hypothetical protein RHGRI_033453 [Rhododendron griersonianum]